LGGYECTSNENEIVKIHVKTKIRKPLPHPLGKFQNNCKNLSFPKELKLALLNL
jgi:hypothetical protein